MRITRRGIERLAESRIRQAMEEGAFDSLATGRPIEGIDEPYDPLWWIRRRIREERLNELPKPDLRKALKADPAALRHLPMGPRSRRRNGC